MSNIELTYYITGCPLEDIQVIPVTKDFRISFLLTAIQDAHLKATGHTIVQLRAYQFDKAEDELTAFDKSNYVRLKNHFRVGGYWPNVPDEGLINLVVEAETLAKARVETSKHQEPHEEDDDVLSDLRVVARLEEAQKKTVKSHMEGKSSSEAAKHVNFKKKQEESDHGIYNGRPYDKTGLPIQLFHEVFNKFTSRIQENEPLPTSKLLHAQKFMMDSQNIYTTENDRCANLEQNLRDLCGLRFSKERVNTVEGDGVLKVISGNTEAYCAILEVKNEIGTGGSDPSVQGAQSYARYWSQPKMAAMRSMCCCPSFILASAGPWMCILGAVYLDRVIVQPLTEFLWLAYDNWESTRLVYIARILDSLATCLQDLGTYYLSINPMSSNPQISRFFPHFLTYRDPEDSLMSLTYSGFVVPESKNHKHRALFKASAKTGETLVVKFTRKYNAIAHRLLAGEGLAPKLLYDSLDDSSHKGPRMIVMQWLDGVDLFNYERSQGTPPDSIRRDIWRALEVLHKQNLVFGDLRRPNVMLVKGPNKVSGMLVDFDWCGIAEEATYPVSMNTEITWAQGVTPGGSMRKQHDLEMYASLFPGFT